MRRTLILAATIAALAAPAQAGMAKHCKKDWAAWEARFGAQLIGPVEHRLNGKTFVTIEWKDGGVHELVLKQTVTGAGFCAVKARVL